MEGGSCRKWGGWDHVARKLVPDLAVVEGAIVMSSTPCPGFVPSLHQGMVAFCEYISHRGIYER